HQPAAGHAELDPDAAVSVIVHVEHFALARAKLFHDHAHEILRHVHGQLLDRLHELASDALGYDLRLSHHQFETLPTHHLNENRKLELAPTHNDEGIRARGVLYAQGNI